MRFSRLAALAAAPAALGLSTPALAMEFDCDTPANHSSSVALPFSGLPLVEGILQHRESRADQFQPTGGIRLQGPAADSYAMLQLMTVADAPGQLLALATVSDGVDLARRRIALFDMAGPINFGLQVLPEGQVVIVVGDQMFNAPFSPVANGQLVVFCSSGHFSFANLAMGASPPPGQ